jgi:hypothetical protein
MASFCAPLLSVPFEPQEFIIEFRPPEWTLKGGRRSARLGLEEADGDDVRSGSGRFGITRTRGRTRAFLADITYLADAYNYDESGRLASVLGAADLRLFSCGLLQSARGAPGCRPMAGLAKSNVNGAGWLEFFILKQSPKASDWSAP